MSANLACDRCGEMIRGSAWSAAWRRRVGPDSEHRHGTVCNSCADALLEGREVGVEIEHLDRMPVDVAAFGSLFGEPLSQLSALRLPRLPVSQ
jgi:hypothetical protein